MKEIFDTYVDNTFDGIRKQADFKFIQFEYNYKKYFPQNMNSKVLDVGIGRGEMLTCMVNWGYKNYFGIDISPSTVNFCSSIGLNCTLVEDTPDWLNKHPNTFELITLIDVLEHIPKKDMIEFLKSIKCALKNNGTLIIQVPNLQAPDGQLHRYNDITHEFGFTEHSMAQVLITAGFTSFHFQGFETFLSDNIRIYAYKIFRYFYRKTVRFYRKINGNINPYILDPVFSVIVKKNSI